MSKVKHASSMRSSHREAGSWTPDAGRAASQRPDGLCVIGFHVERYSLDRFGRDLAAAGFTLEHRFATWDLSPWREDADFAVTILRA